jgi:hypothetical protein
MAIKAPEPTGFWSVFPVGYTASLNDRHFTSSEEAQAWLELALPNLVRPREHWEVAHCYPAWCCEECHAELTLEYAVRVALRPLALDYCGELDRLVVIENYQHDHYFHLELDKYVHEWLTGSTYGIYCSGCDEQFHFEATTAPPAAGPPLQIQVDQLKPAACCGELYCYGFCCEQVQSGNVPPGFQEETAEQTVERFAWNTYLEAVNKLARNLKRSGVDESLLLREAERTIKYYPDPLDGYGL